MTKQADREIVSLLILAEQSEGENARVSARHIANLFQPPISVDQADISLKYLIKLGLADGNFDNPRNAGFRITRKGLHIVDQNFDRTDHQHDTDWRHKPDAPTDLATMLNPPPSTITTVSEAAPASQSPVINIHNSFEPTMTHNVNAPKSASSLATILGSWGTWVGVLLAAIAVYVSLHLAGKV